jgi:Ca-activated chloride channel homolog
MNVINSKTWTLAGGLFIILFSVISLPKSFAQLSGYSSPDSPSATEFQSSAIIRVNTNLVIVPVSVTDTKGNAVLNLQMNDFRIEEDGQAEEVQKMAEAGRSPLQIALLFDRSGSISPRFEFEQKAAVRFLEKVWKPGDSISIISFTDQPQILIKNSQSLKDALQELTTLQPTEKATAFFDSVIYSAKLLHTTASSETRRAEIVLSDGDDNQSDNTLTNALKEVQRADSIFYSINPGGSSIRLNTGAINGQKGLNSLATETGGTAFVSDEKSDLDQIFGLIATELQTQYLLSYYSSNPNIDGKFRQIAISIPQRPELRVRARQGYYALTK